MSLDPQADWDEPVRMDFDEPEEPKPTKKSGAKKREKKKPAGIPRLPEPVKPLTDAEVRRGVSNRDKSATNLKLAGASYQEIADTLEFDTAADAKRAVERTLAATHSPDDWQTLRMVASARAEDLFKHSLAMAKADYLVLEDGEKVPNNDRLRWHQQAAADLMNHVQITGAKAPTKLEISPDEAKMEELVSAILARSGEEDILDAEVIELGEIPSSEVEVYRDGRD